MVIHGMVREYSYIPGIVLILLNSHQLQPLSTLGTPDTDNTSSDESNASQQLGPSFSTTTSKSIKRLLCQLMLTNSNTKEIVGDTSSE